MSDKKSSYSLFLLITFCLFLIPAFGANYSSDMLYEIEYFIKVYKNGTVERLSGTQTVPPSLQPSSGVMSKDILIDPTLNITARLFRPRIAASISHKVPLLVYFHGGGFCTESPFSPTYHNYVNSVVAEANVVAVSVNYRLTPEHPLPTAYHDSWQALKWVFSHSSGEGNETWLRKNVDFEHVYLGGDSAGGNIAHNVAMRAGLEKTGITIHGLFLNCPHFWGNTRIGKEASFPKERIDWVESIWIHAYPNSTGFDDPSSNPGVDPNLWKLGTKKVLVYVAEKDVLRDRGLYYGKALKRSKWGGVVKVVEAKGEDHVFNLLSPNSTNAKNMMRRVAFFLINHELELPVREYVARSTQ